MRFKVNHRATMWAMGLLIMSAQTVLGHPTPVGSDFVVNTLTASDQGRPDVAMDADGDFVVVWQDQAFIAARRFERTGSPIGNNFYVSWDWSHFQSRPRVATGSAGDFVVVWESGDDKDGADWGIFARRYDSAGGSIGGEFQVNTHTTSYQSRPDVAMMPDGGFVVVWDSIQDGSEQGIFGQLFDDQGSPAGSEFQLNTYTYGFQIYPSVATDATGNFVVVWWSEHQDLSDGGVVGRRFNSTGSPIGTEFLVNSYTTFSQKTPKVAMDAQGAFIVVWDHRWDVNPFHNDIYGRRYDSAGNPVSDQFRVNYHTTGDQVKPSVAMEGDGDYVVTWAGYDDQDGSFGGVFAYASGEGWFQVNSYTTALQTRPELAGNTSGNFVVAWEDDNWSSEGQDGSGMGVIARRFRKPCSASAGLPAWQWKMISLPCDPGAANTVAEVLGDDLTGTYDWDWVVYERDEATASYNKLLLTDPMAMGVGYWIQTALSGETVQVDGLSPYVTDVALTASATGTQNLVGHPFDFDVCWADVRVIDGGSVLTLDEADPAGECEKPSPGPTCIMSRIVHKWTGAAYAPYDGITPGAEGTISPLDALWVKAFKSGISLRIPAQVSASCTGAKSFDAQPATGPGAWYVRLIAESGDLRDRDSVFGQLADSVDGYDVHDLLELPPSTEPYLTVVFPHPDWMGQAGDYATDYHARERRTDTWRIAVRASSGVARVRLRWAGPSVKMWPMQLRDEESNKTLWMRPGGSYTFEVTGGERIFTVTAYLGELSAVPKRCVRTEEFEPRRGARPS